MHESSKRWYERTYDWIESRVQLADFVKDSAAHQVPSKTASWFYVFGSASFVLLLLQIVTGILLATIYVPSAGQAWSSLEVLNHQLPLGWFLRAMHGWGSNFMVAVVLVHMMQVFIFGAYKFPRELTWLLGVGLLLMTLGMAFSGQILRFDQDAYWGLGIGASITSRVPFIGNEAVHLMLGGPIIAGATLSRFFALHVFVLPATMLAFAGLHVWLVLKLGINEWPTPGRLVRRETYIKEYHELTHRHGVPFVPQAVWKDALFAAAIIFAVAFCAAVFGPFGPTGTPDPTITQTAPRPDFFFLWIYSALAYLPPSVETPLIFIAPVIGIGVLIGLPFIAGVGEKSWYRRPVGVLTLLVVAVGLATLTHLGTYAPWSPHMNAWTADEIPDRFVHGSTPLERQGALIFKVKQCHNCHALGGLGGQRGPALDTVASHLTEDQIIRQVIQGGGNMPAYGAALSPPEVTALVAFLDTLHPPNERPATDASRSIAETDKPAPKEPVESTKP
jgi:ubiquinol-cytochrome c reductase cytochrome b subunit